jgi:hypothetical protein
MASMPAAAVARMVFLSMVLILRVAGSAGPSVDRRSVGRPIVMAFVAAAL